MVGGFLDVKTKNKLEFYLYGNKLLRDNNATLKGKGFHVGSDSDVIVNGCDIGGKDVAVGARVQVVSGVMGASNCHFCRL